MHGDGIVDGVREGRRRRREGGGGRRYLSAMPSFSVRVRSESFACQSTLASNFLHAIARYWNCLVGDLSPSVIYFLNRSYLPACLASPARPSITSYGLPSCARVCEHTRLRGTRNFPMPKPIHERPSLFLTAFLSYCRDFTQCDVCVF